MRNFDTWNRYLDNHGNPLHGCVEFMVGQGDTPAQIYDQDGVGLSNPQVTDIYGRTQHQVFVDSDVTAYFYRYVGHGIWTSEEDIDTSDVTKWSLQYTVSSTSDTRITVQSSSTVCVPTIEALRDTDPESVPAVSGTTAVTLMGYYSAGDKQPVTYVYDPESDDQDDGGSVIQPTEQDGRWILVRPERICDSRHFGVFPQSSSNTPDQTYGITKLFQYCYFNSLSPYFNGCPDARWFKYQDLVVTSTCPIVVSAGTYFKDEGTCYIAGEWEGDPYFYNHSTQLQCREVRTSWGAASYNNYETVRFDADSEQKQWQDCNMVLTASVSGYDFQDCTFSGDSGMLKGGNTFQDCELDGRMVDGDCYLANMCTGCTLDIDTFYGKEDIWRQWRFTDCSSPYIDYRHIQKAGLNPITHFYGNKVTADNVSVFNYDSVDRNSNVTVEKLDNTVINLVNCTGKFTLGAYSTGDTVVIRDCRDLAISSIGGGCNLIVEHSVVNLPNNITVESASFRDSQVTGFTTVTCKSFTSYGSILQVGARAASVLVKDSQVNNPITFVAESGSGLWYVNNICNATLTISGKEGTQSVVGAICDNQGNAATPITVDRTYLAPSESSHAYTYSNNTGTFRKREVTFTETTTVLNDIQSYTGYEWFWSITGYTCPYIGIPVEYGTDFSFGTQVSPFRIGTDDQDVTVEWVNNNANDMTYVQLMPLRFRATLEHTSGESYRVKVKWKGSGTAGTQLTNTAVMNVNSSATSIGTGSVNNTYTVSF